ncbi:MAG: hypothetical protein QXE05_00320 [Nitrososphaeria archaeon]
MDLANLIVEFKSSLKDNFQLVKNVHHHLNNFLGILYQNWRNETNLLNALIGRSYLIVPRKFVGRQLAINFGVFRTHQKYIGPGNHREFGDIMFVLLLNDFKSRRVGYANVYQIKVGQDFKSILNKVDYRQYRFYNYQLLPSLQRSSYNWSSVPVMVGDFLYYWLVFNKRVSEIPLSALTLENETIYFRHLINSSALAWTTLLNNTFLVSGISIDHILPLAKPSLRMLLERLLDVGVKVDGSTRILYNGGEEDAGEKWDKTEFPIDGRIVIALEISKEG